MCMDKYIKLDPAEFSFVICVHVLSKLTTLHWTINKTVHP